MINTHLDEPAPPLNYSIYGITFWKIGNVRAGCHERPTRLYIGSMQGGETYESMVLVTLVHPDAHGRLCLKLSGGNEAGEP
jgi:hypothetical protein